MRSTSTKGSFDTERIYSKTPFGSEDQFDDIYLESISHLEDNQALQARRVKLYSKSMNECIGSHCLLRLLFL